MCILSMPSDQKFPRESLDFPLSRRPSQKDSSSG
jgi:hypothetical protein